LWDLRGTWSPQSARVKPRKPPFVERSRRWAATASLQENRLVGRAFRGFGGRHASGLVVPCPQWVECGHKRHQRAGTIRTESIGLGQDLIISFA